MQRNTKNRNAILNLSIQANRHYIIQWFIDNFGLWVLGLAVSHIHESNCKLMSPEYYFNDKSAILLHPWTRWNKNFASQRQNYAQKMQDAQVTKSLSYKSLHSVLQYMVILITDCTQKFVRKYLIRQQKSAETGVLFSESL